ncbi:secreted protein, putative [Ixodes scapularis]|uniref:Secreted protein, putative n=1 Tax=Ixodes scapularis TaxID=6945 RepID=B7PFD9_IXOSC|nr:secreted protein, putative [Ixodes scapularis]|eukprot:XP_002433911.1 secreted protein, putative [Ixodes scapularis]
MKQQIFILLAALQLSYQEHESPSVHTPDEVIQENYKRLSPRCKTEIKLQMEQICKVHDRFKYNEPSKHMCSFFFFLLDSAAFCSRCPNIFTPGGSPKIGQNFRICKNGKCVSTPNNCEIDYFFS